MQFERDVTYKIFCSNTDMDGTTLPVQTDTWIRYNENTEVWYNSKAITAALKEIKTIKPDVLFINGIYSIRYTLIPLLFFKASKKIVSARGMLHPGALSQKSVKKKLYLFLWKMLGLHRKCDFHASTEQEKKYIKTIFGSTAKVYIAQNFPKIISHLSMPEKKPGLLRLISIALISPMKNHLLVLKALLNCKGLIYYTIYGPIKDNAYWNNCIELINKMPSNVTVKYCGDIPPVKVEDILKENHVFILPSKSENFGHAIFEALSAGKPVITSNNTPWNNLEISKAGLNVNPENTEELVGAIDKFAAMDDMEISQWHSGAKKYSTSAINIEDIKNQYKEMFFA